MNAVSKLRHDLLNRAVEETKAHLHQESNRKRGIVLAVEAPRYFLLSRGSEAFVSVYVFYISFVFITNEFQ